MPSGQGRDGEKESTRIPLLMPLFTETCQLLTGHHLLSDLLTMHQLGSDFQKSQRTYRPKIPAHLPPATIDFVSCAV